MVHNKGYIFIKGIMEKYQSRRSVLRMVFVDKEENDDYVPRDIL